MNSWNVLQVQLLGDLLQRYPLPEQRVDLLPPYVVTLVAERIDPVPPKASKHDEMRYFDIHEDADLDEDQLVSWIEQASNLPGQKM